MKPFRIPHWPALLGACRFGSTGPWLAAVGVVACLGAVAPVWPATGDEGGERETLEAIPLRGTVIETLTLKGEDAVDTLRLNLNTLVNMVARNNLDVALSKAQIEQGKGYMNQAIAGLFPSVRAFTSYERLKGGDVFILQQPFTVDRRTWVPRLSADLNIPLGGKTIYQMIAAKAQLNRLRTSQKKTFQIALSDAITQYFAWLRDAAAVEAAEQSLKEADAQLAFNRSRYKAGFGTMLDVAQSETLQAQRKVELLKAVNQKEISAITLASTLNLPLSLRLELETTELKQLPLVEPSLGLPQLYKMAVENRPEVAELEFQVKEARARYGASRADLFPSVTLSGFRRGVGPTLEALQETNQVFGSMSVDLLRNMGWSVMSDMQVQRGRIAEAQVNLEKQLNEIQKTLSQAYADSNLYQAQVGATRQKMESAREGYRIAAARLRSGVGLNLEVVQAQKDLNDARLEYQTAIMNYNNAQVRLMYEIGQLTPHNLLFALKAYQEAQQPKIIRSSTDPRLERLIDYYKLTPEPFPPANESSVPAESAPVVPVIEPVSKPAPAETSVESLSQPNPSSSTQDAGTVSPVPVAPASPLSMPVAQPQEVPASPSKTVPEPSQEETLPVKEDSDIPPIEPVPGPPISTNSPFPVSATLGVAPLPQLPVEVAPAP